MVVSFCSDDTCNNSDFIEDHINRTIEEIQWMIHPLQGKITPEEKEAAAVITISAATIKNCELQINILKTASRDAAKLREILQAKEKQYEKAQDSEDIERLVIEIDMLRYLLFLVNRKKCRSGRRDATVKQAGF